MVKRDTRLLSLLYESICVHLFYVVSCFSPGPTPGHLGGTNELCITKVRSAELKGWICDNRSIVAAPLAQPCDGSLACIPLGASNFDLRWLEWVPPATEMAKHALSGNRRCMAYQYNIRKRQTCFPFSKNTRQEYDFTN